MPLGVVCIDVQRLRTNRLRFIRPPATARTPQGTLTGGSSQRGQGSSRSPAPPPRRHDVTLLTTAPPQPPSRYHKNLNRPLRSGNTTTGSRTPSHQELQPHSSMNWSNASGQATTEQMQQQNALEAGSFQCDGQVEEEKEEDEGGCEEEDARSPKSETSGLPMPTPSPPRRKFTGVPQERSAVPETHQQEEALGVTVATKDEKLEETKNRNTVSGGQNQEAKKVSSPGEPTATEAQNVQKRLETELASSQATCPKEKDTKEKIIAQWLAQQTEQLKEDPAESAGTAAQADIEVKENGTEKGEDDEPAGGVTMIGNGSSSPFHRKEEEEIVKQGELPNHRLIIDPTGAGAKNVVTQFEHFVPQEPKFREGERESRRVAAPLSRNVRGLTSPKASSSSGGADRMHRDTIVIHEPQDEAAHFLGNSIKQSCIRPAKGTSLSLYTANVPHEELGTLQVEERQRLFEEAFRNPRRMIRTAPIGRQQTFNNSGSGGGCGGVDSPTKVPKSVSSSSEAVPPQVDRGGYTPSPPSNNLCRQVPFGKKSPTKKQGSSSPGREGGRVGTWLSQREAEQTHRRKKLQVLHYVQGEREEGTGGTQKQSVAMQLGVTADANNPRNSKEASLQKSDTFGGSATFSSTTGCLNASSTFNYKSVSDRHRHTSPVSQMLIDLQDQFQLQQQLLKKDPEMDAIHLRKSSSARMKYISKDGTTDETMGKKPLSRQAIRSLEIAEGHLKSHGRRIEAGNSDMQQVLLQGVHDWKRRVEVQEKVDSGLVHPPAKLQATDEYLSWEAPATQRYCTNPSTREFVESQRQAKDFSKREAGLPPPCAGLAARFPILLEDRVKLRKEEWKRKQEETTAVLTASTKSPPKEKKLRDGEESTKERTPGMASIALAEVRNEAPSSDALIELRIISDLPHRQLASHILRCKRLLRKDSEGKRVHRKEILGGMALRRPGK